MNLNVSKEILQKMASGIKYPHNGEWDDSYNEIINNVIAAWKKASIKQRIKWINESHEFYDDIAPGLSDDGWDYFGPQYIYYDEDDLSNIPARYLPNVIKQAIIKYHFDDGSIKNKLFNFSFKVQDTWNNISSKLSLKEKFEKGFVSKEFAKAMKEYKNDPKAWEAIEAFYDSGNRY